MTRFTFHPTAIAGVVVVERTVLGDARGFLSRLFAADEFAAAGFALPVVDLNHTRTAAAGTLRGLHFQYPPAAEIKLVTCVAGEVHDVAVDLRRGSPTFLSWHAERLSLRNRRALLIPRGCAHGFQALTADSELVYLHSAAYAPAAEGGIDPYDHRLAIDWPLAVTEMSARDRAHPPLGDAFTGIDA